MQKDKGAKIVFFILLAVLVVGGASVGFEKPGRFVPTSFTPPQKIEQKITADKMETPKTAWKTGTYKNLSFKYPASYTTNNQDDGAVGILDPIGYELVKFGGDYGPYSAYYKCEDSGFTKGDADGNYVYLCGVRKGVTIITFAKDENFTGTFKSIVASIQ